MLNPILQLGKVEVSSLFDHLYAIFHRDFVQGKAMLGGKIWIDPQSTRKDEGKEQAFWHLITRGKPGDRLTDYRRAERLEWVRQIVDSPEDECIVAFYHKESNAKQDVRLYLWAADDDFVVILQRLGRSAAFLVTSFYVDQRSKRDDYQKRYDHFMSGRDPALSATRWF